VGPPRIPNVVLNLPDTGANDFYTWHQDFVIQGNNGADKEKNGTLEFLSADLRTATFTLSLERLGIFRLTPEKVEAGSESIRRVKVEMYCQRMNFAADPSASR
jgi:hypothetical protein